MILNTLKKATLSVLLVALLFMLAITATAHPGSTDEDGGHVDRSTGEYHYHHGYPAHEHYDMDHDGKIDCPYDFDDQTGKNSGNGTGRNESDFEDEYYIEEYNDDSEYNLEDDEGYESSNEEDSYNENDSKDFKNYLNIFLISLVSLIIAAIIWYLVDELNLGCNVPIVKYILLGLLFVFGGIGLFAAGIIAITVFLLQLLCVHICGGIRDHRIKLCKEYATLLIASIENRNLISPSEYLLSELRKKIYAKPQLYKKPFQIRVQKTLYEIASFEINHCTDSEQRATAQYIQLRIIQEKLLEMLKINGVEIDVSNLDT